MKQSIRLLCLSLFVMVANMLFASAPPDGANVAKIGDTEYPTLEDAVAAVPATGEKTTITLLSNVSQSGNHLITVASGKNVGMCR